MLAERHLGKRRDGLIKPSNVDDLGLL